MNAAELRERALAIDPTVGELEALDASLDQLASVEARIAEFAPVADALRRQTERSRRLTPRLARLVLSLPADVHLHRIFLERSGPTTLEVHGADPVETVQALASSWSGRVRLDGGTSSGSQDALAEPFTVVLEPGS